MRRSIVIAVLAGALVGLVAAAGLSLAGSGGEGSSKPGASSSSQAGFQATYAAKRGRHGHRRGHRGGPGHGLRFGPLAMAFSGLAERLDVSKRALRDALKGVKGRALDRAVADGTITQAERGVLERCMKSHARRDRRQGGRRGRSGSRDCDRRTARAAHRKLHRALKARARDDAAALKAQFIDDLAAELGKQPSEVDDAARAELSELLDTAVKLGFVSERGRELALGCWDRPDDCDRAALRAEVKKRFRGHRRGHGGRRGGGRP